MAHSCPSIGRLASIRAAGSRWTIPDPIKSLPDRGSSRVIVAQKCHKALRLVFGTMGQCEMKIDDLRQQPHFADAVVDRIWRAFWEKMGHPVERVSIPVGRNLASTEAKPFCLIAHANGTFLGSASLIASDVDNRPLLTPWVAAVWVKRRIANAASGVAGGSCSETSLRTRGARTFSALC